VCVCVCVCVCVWSERSYVTNTVTSLTLFGNTKAVNGIFSITDHIRSGVTSCHAFSDACSLVGHVTGLLVPSSLPISIDLEFGFGPFLPFPTTFLYRAPPFSCVRSPTIASSTPNPTPRSSISVTCQTELRIYARARKLAREVVCVYLLEWGVAMCLT
jgi:hypothetical protein